MLLIDSPSKGVKLGYSEPTGTISRISKNTNEVNDMVVINDPITASIELLSLGCLNKSVKPNDFEPVTPKSNRNKTTNTLTDDLYDVAVIVDSAPATGEAESINKIVKLSSLEPIGPISTRSKATGKNGSNLEPFTPKSIRYKATNKGKSEPDNISIIVESIPASKDESKSVNVRPGASHVVS